MTTPAQTIFPPKPKVVITPLTPRHVADAIREKHQQKSVQPEREDGDEGGQTAKTGRRNRLLREAQSEE